VPGVEVGHTTLVRGEGKLVVGKGAVRTSVTAILPRGRRETAPAFASWFSLNGNGEMTGTAWIDESGVLDGPVLLTNTHSVGIVPDAVVEWMIHRDPTLTWVLPVVAETYDGFLNDINGMHVKKEHVFAALDGARGGPVAEGNVGGGTGMRLYRFKGGIGTASRKLPAAQVGHHVGVLVQANLPPARAGRHATVQLWPNDCLQSPAVGRMMPAGPPIRYNPTSGLLRCFRSSTQVVRQAARCRPGGNCSASVAWRWAVSPGRASGCDRAALPGNGVERTLSRLTSRSSSYSSKAGRRRSRRLTPKGTFLKRFAVAPGRCGHACRVYGLAERVRNWRSAPTASRWCGPTAAANRITSSMSP
jgi:hypothetical protein